MTTRDELAKGPKFNEELDFVETGPQLGPDDRDVRLKICEACGEPSFFRDRDTGLCRPCWRAWRFSLREALVWKYGSTDPEFTETEERARREAAGACPSCGATHKRPAAIDAAKFRNCGDPWHNP